ncbi:MAG: hypothetical protein HZA58_02215 [Acidimicrobiia bacterium]|nr:hypothetical protein [Acidimicrobiia bacterium]
MRIAGEYNLLAVGDAGVRLRESGALVEIRQAITEVVWPVGSDIFTIFPESGKKGGEGNGVVPIRQSFVERARSRGWTVEQPFPWTTEAGESDLGPLDVSKRFGPDLVGVEWETGNVSSSHRTLNKLSLGLEEGVLAVGVLIVPTRTLARFLTDRIGNLEELKPYFRHFRRIRCDSGVLTVIAVEQDAESTAVPRIRKGTDGRAMR